MGIITSYTDDDVTTDDDRFLTSTNTGATKLTPASNLKEYLGFSTNPSGGWDSLNVVPTTTSGYNKGNKEFDVVFNGVNLTTVLSPGMRMKLDRTGTVPTQCTDLEASSSQYWSKSSPTGITFTDDFTCEAWVKLESYPAAGTAGGVIGRFVGSAGWGFRINSSGVIVIFAGSGGAFDDYSSYQPVPLNQWVHIAASLDMSASTAKAYLNGVEIPGLYVNSGGTSLTQSGDLNVGRYDASTYFDGEIAHARVWSTIRTATQIRDNMAISTVGNETGLVADFKFNGNGNDSTSNANNLTASGGATATTVDNPFKATEYALVTKVSFSTNTTVTLFTGTDYNIPNMVLQNPYYSTQKTPYGFNASKGKWTLTCINKGNSSSSAVGWVNLDGQNTSIPTGEWKIVIMGSLETNYGGAGQIDFTFSPSSTSEVDTYWRVSRYEGSAGHRITPFYKSGMITNTTATTYYALSSGAAAPHSLRGDLNPLIIKAESAYI